MKTSVSKDLKEKRIKMEKTERERERVGNEERETTE